MAEPPLLTLDELRPAARWAAGCAERTLAIFEAHASDDLRPREAIAAARAFADSGLRTAALRKAAWAALAAAKDVIDPAAASAARAASAAAAVAYTHSIATPHQVNHLLSPAAYSAQAAALAAPDPPGAELRWALDHAGPDVCRLVHRMQARQPGKSGWSALLYDLDAGLRHSAAEKSPAVK